MHLRSSLIAVTLVTAIAILGGSAWWLIRPRPTLDGAARRIDLGQFQAAEGQLREYLAVHPGDETASLLLAKLLVVRPEPEPEEALRLAEGICPADPHRSALARAIEGDACFWANTYDKAEAAWLAAIGLEPAIPEVGWKLLNIYALQGRDLDSRRLALRLFATEPDERDRVQLLLQSIRPDAHPAEAGSIVHLLEPIVRANPADVRSSTSLARNLIAVGRTEEGIAMLRRDAASHASDPEVQLAFLEGLVTTGDTDELTTAMSGLSPSMACTPRFDAVKGWLAAQRGEFDEAIRAYRRAFDARPAGPSASETALSHRLRSTLHRADRDAELAELGPRLDAVTRFPAEARDFFDRLSQLPDLGLTTHPEEFARLAAVLGEVGRDEEAAAWTILARRHAPAGP